MIATHFGGLTVPVELVEVESKVVICFRNRLLSSLKYRAGSFWKKTSELLGEPLWRLYVNACVGDESDDDV